MKPLNPQDEPDLAPIRDRCVRIIESWGNWEISTLDDLYRLTDCAQQISRELWIEGLLDLDLFGPREREW